MVDVPKGHEYEDIELSETHSTVSQPVTSRGDRVHVKREGLITIEGPHAYICTCESQSETVGMGVALISYDVYDTPQINGPQRKTIQGSWKLIPKILGCIAYVYQHKGSSSRSIFIELGMKSTRSNVTTWTKVISSMYCQGILPSPIERYISKDAMSKFSNLSSRAWDISVPPIGGHLFTSKPDGERMWMVLYGKIWYVVRPRFNSNVLQWVVSSRSWLKSGAICVIDVEWVGRYGLVLIDVLSDIEGNYATGIRDVQWVKDKFAYISTGHTCLNVNVRKYFDTFSEANSYCASVPYPTDGVVAIRNGSTEASKIKAIKSMELLHEGDGVLKSADGIEIARSMSAAIFKPGSIIEIRFTLNSTTMVPDIIDMFQRSDKQLANSHSAISNIISSCIIEQTPGDNERRAALLWCNELRKQLHTRAVTINPNRSIILDIGSGDGQALDVALASEQVSYIYVEPDSNKCRQLRRRLGKCELVQEPADIIPYIRSLKTRSMNSIIFNNTLASITDNDDVMDRLCPELKSATCTFSMHFVVAELHQLAMYKVPIYGCTYTYDAVNSDGILIDASGVVMKMKEDGVATVSWGRDKVYEEPATRKRDYAGIAKFVPGADMLQLPDSVISPHARTICSKISVLLP